jgi:hypothetical protein
MPPDPPGRLCITHRSITVREGKTMNRERQVTLKDLKEMNDDALVQLLADAAQELNWRHRTRKLLGWVAEHTLREDPPLN